ncbi:heme uptake protein IsdC [Lysinibacillus xylanilyticus]|uniref:Heme uptake protein IsdC n=1 Tax=Lysinibacillus xylanilyticus TaxID=582475 RepID=A0ABT4EMG0_9BACI|nr:heme uptake protein IsdC [Lysinibacillus xylanilyticus]MCY9546832.1 heme uptake protein IsdC [Lysinibacillus xylanilyticus]
MKKLMMFVMLVTLFVFNMALPQASAQLADGTHSIKYQVNKPESNSASIANDYFLKPAKVTLKNGTATVQITLKNSAWITKFQPPGGATVVSDDKAADTRTVQFTVKDLTKPVVTSMKIDIDDINYHHEYSVSLVFDAASAGSATEAKASETKTTDAPAKASDSKTTNAPTNSSESHVPNPQTSDATPYVLIVALVGSAFLLYRKKLQTKTEGQ